MKQSLWNEIVDCYKNYLKQDLTPTDLKIFLDSIQFIVRGIVNSSKLLYSIDSLENNEFESTIFDLLLLVAEKNFPLSTSELVTGSVLYVKYSTILQNLLDLLVQTGSPILFDILRLTCNEKQHIELKNIISSFIKLSKGIRRDKSSIIALLYYYINLLSKSSDAIYYIELLHKYVIFPLLSNTGKFMLIDIITTPFIEYNNNKISALKYALNTIDKQLPIDNYYTLLSPKIFSFKLMSVIYDNISADLIRNNLCKHFSGDNCKGNEITRLLCAKCRQSAVIKCPDDDELYKEYVVYAFDCIATVVRNTQTDQKFFDGLVLKEDQLKGECLWDNLSPNVSLKFDIETEFETDEWNNVITNIRKTYETTTTQTFLSQYLVGSSLSQKDLNKNSDIIHSLDDNSKQDLIELDPINSSYSMIAILKIIDHIYNKFSKNWINPPLWLENWIIKLSDPSAKLNTRFFIMKIILNRPKIFEKYAQHLVLPLMQCLIDIDKENNINNDFHYIMRDLCLLYILFILDYQIGIIYFQQQYNYHMFQHL